MKETKGTEEVVEGRRRLTSGGWWWLRRDGQEEGDKMEEEEGGKQKRRERKKPRAFVCMCVYMCVYVKPAGLFHLYDSTSRRKRRERETITLP
jgi:hypothetical protein